MKKTTISKKRDSTRIPLKGIISQSKGGFTIIELLIVIVIMTLLMGVSLFKYKDYSDNVSLYNTALDVALTAREAQTYSATARGTSAAGFFHAYGIYVNLATPDTYTFFVDSTIDDFWYNGATEDIREITLESGYILSDICVGPIIIADCTPTEAVIAFKRPNLAARISTSNGGAVFEQIQLIFSSPNGKIKTVHVTITGQIYVD